MFQDTNVGISKVGVVKVSESSSLLSKSGDSVRDSIRDNSAMYLVNSSKLTLPSSSEWVGWVGVEGEGFGVERE